MKIGSLSYIINVDMTMADWWIGKRSKWGWDRVRGTTWLL